MAWLDAAFSSSTTTTPAISVANNGGAITLAADDTMLLAVTVDSTSPNFEDADYPTSFAELAETDIAAPDGQTASLSWKRLTGADTGTYTFSAAINGSAVTFLGCSISFRGRHATNPPVAVVSTSTASNASPVSITATGLTAEAGDDLVIIAVPDVTASGVANVFTPPSGYTLVDQFETGFLAIYIAVKENVSAGATGDQVSTLTLTGSASGWICHHLRIPSASGGGGGGSGILRQLLAHMGG